jgi:ASC-1-like (ASCH) protein
MLYHMRLKSEHFKLVQTGKKIVECRLYDDKRKQLHVGDHIEFTDAKTDGKKVMTRVMALHQFPNFIELLDHFPISSFGGKNKDELLSELRDIYSEEDEKKFGVLGIEIECYNEA